MRVAVRLLIAVVAVEAALQVVAYAVWRRAWIGPSGGVERSVALVVGDNLAFEEGVATREDAWPAEVEKLLGRKYPDLRVVNGAAPGRDSRDVLLRLEQQLDELSPGLVYLRLGATDLRRAAVPVVGDDELRGRVAPFALRLRLPAALIGMFAGTRSAAGGPTTIIGAWHAGDVELRIEPDGQVKFGSSVGIWHGDADRITIEFQGVAAAHASVVHSGSGEQLRVDMPNTQLGFVRGPRAADVGQAVEMLLEHGSWAEARWLLETAAQSATPSASALASLVELDVREGRMDDTESRLARLDGLATDPAAGAERLRAWIALGRCRETVEALEANLGLLDGQGLLRKRLVSMPDEQQRARLATAVQRRAGQGDADFATALRGPRDPAVAIGEDERRARQAVLAANLRRSIELCRFYGATAILLSPGEVPAAAETVAEVARVTGTDLVVAPSRRSAMREALLSDLDARLAESK